MAAMMRRAGGVDEAEVAAAVGRERERLEASYRDRVQNEVEMRTHKSSAALEKLAEFERETGLSLNGYGAIKEIADAVRFIQHTSALATWRGLEGMASEAEKFAAKVREFTRTNPAPSSDTLI
jgi:hypothetical protein